MSTAIIELKAQIATKQAEFDRVRDELDILRRALSIISGRKMDDGSTSAHRSGQKIPDLIREALNEGGVPLSADELVANVKAKGCQASRQTILGAAYRTAKDRRGIELVKAGVFGILRVGEDLI